MNWRLWRHNKRDISRRQSMRGGFHRANAARLKARQDKAALLRELKERERLAREEDGHAV